MVLHTLSDSSEGSDDEASDVPATMPELGNYCREQNLDTTNGFIKSHHGLDTINKVEVITRGQSDNPDWYLYRKDINCKNRLEMEKILCLSYFPRFLSSELHPSAAQKYPFVAFPDIVQFRSFAGIHK
ncbi:hypothetical protein KUTeg_011240 [Tegillarca granosa]|uniref:Uncharacterized protein n=1 Tax=Tegillarca granosa TaxID=220873 RepID=A0ABQ9F1E5_TEGGR|nr:hypothetical protein KUTeg_011240 [Tegillarca granosa]